MNPDQIKKSQKQINEEEYIINYNDDTLKYVQKPIGKALYKGKGRPPMIEDEKAKPSDKIQCKLCNNLFVRSNRSHHNKTQKHKLYEKINTKLAKLVIDN